MIFDSTATKQTYETRDATFVKDYQGVTYTCRLRAKGAAKQLLVTVQQSPLILNGELALYFRRFSLVKKVVGQSNTFSHQIDSGLTRIILLSNKGVEARNIPCFMKTSYGIKRKLFFQGKLFLLQQIP